MKRENSLQIRRRRARRLRAISARLLLAASASVTSIAEALAQADPDLNADLSADRAADLRQTAIRKLNEDFEAAARRRPIGPFKAPQVRTPVDPGGHYLTFAFDAPVSYNTNPGNSNAGSSSMRFDPKVQLNGGYQFPLALLSANVTADLERYPENPAQHANTVIPNISLDLNRPAIDPADNTYKPQAIVPSVFYQSILSAPSSTADFTSRIHEFGAGVSGSTAFGMWSIGGELGIAKRSSNASPSSQAITVKPSVTYKFDAQKEWSASFAPSLKRREFEADGTGTTRRDTTLALPFKVVWSPVAEKWKGWDFFFFTSPSSNHSTANGKDRHQNDTGLMAHYVYTFNKF